MKIVISHPHGNQNTTRAVETIEKLKLLDILDNISISNQF